MKVFMQFTINGTMTRCKSLPLLTKESYAGNVGLIID